MKIEDRDEDEEEERRGANNITSLGANEKSLLLHRYIQYSKVKLAANIKATR